MAQKWPKIGLHDPMMSSSHHPIITTWHHPIIASSHLGTPHLFWKWLSNTTSQKIFLGGQTISLRFLTPQRGSINMRFAAFSRSTRLAHFGLKSRFAEVLSSITPACPLVKARLSIQTMINRPFTSNDRTTICFNFQYSRKPAALLCFPNDELLSIFPRVTHERVKKKKRSQDK